MALSARERQVRARLKQDFLHYAPRCLRIRTKAGAVLPFRLNAAQLHLHRALEQQRAETGQVRALIVKGRQQGCSTYVQARFFWHVTHRRGVRAFILTHVEDATANLFGMAKRFYDHCPDLVRPRRAASNAKELLFDRLESGYRVGTAGGRGTARSDTIQYFHGSEVAYLVPANGTIVHDERAIWLEVDCGAAVDIRIFVEATMLCLHSCQFGDRFMSWFWAIERCAALDPACIIHVDNAGADQQRAVEMMGMDMNRQLRPRQFKQFEILQHHFCAGMAIFTGNIRREHQD